MSTTYIVIGESKIYHATPQANRADTVCGQNLSNNWFRTYSKRPSRKRMCSKCKAMLKVARKAKKMYKI